MIMKNIQKFFLAFSVLFLFCGKSNAQVDSLLIGIEESPQPLLPEKMGFVKKAFWGENGLMRSLKISPLTPEGRQKELRVRRTMLRMHQFFGIATVVGMGTSIYFGQKIKSGNYDYVSKMDVSGVTTAVLYGTTALLQLLAPPPLIIRKADKGWSSIQVHRTLAYVHLTAIIATAVSGRYLVKNGYDNMTFHQVSAYVATASLAGAMIVMTF
jgi:hypothetical protein